eukprot:6205018-Pleurochrysis_carterae.AAC.5
MRHAEAGLQAHCGYCAHHISTAAHRSTKKEPAQKIRSFMRSQHRQCRSRESYRCVCGGCGAERVRARPRDAKTNAPAARSANESLRVPT